MGYILAIVMGYLLGCSNLAYYISRTEKKDIRQSGSGNLGASNATILFGWKAGVAVAVHDAGKALLAVLLAKMFFPGLEHAGAVAGVAAVLGHIFPFYLKFKGGKGTASFIGMTLALNWKLALVLAVVAFILTVLTDYIVTATVTTVTVVPVYMGIASADWILALIVALGTVVILWKHRENFWRILNHTEAGLRAAIRGEQRIK